MDDFEQPVRYYDENGEPHDGIIVEGTWMEESIDLPAFVAQAIHGESNEATIGCHLSRGD